MVLPLLIVIGTLLLIFSPKIAEAVKGIVSSDNSDVQKQQEMKELQKQVKREDEGIFKTVGRILFGDNIYDNSIDAKSNQEFEEKAQLLKTKQATDAGFESIKELEIATDPNRDLTKFNPPGVIAYGTKFSRKRTVFG